MWLDVAQRRSRNRTHVRAPVLGEPNGEPSRRAEAGSACSSGGAGQRYSPVSLSLRDAGSVPACRSGARASAGAALRDGRPRSFILVPGSRQQARSGKLAAQEPAGFAAASAPGAPITFCEWCQAGSRALSDRFKISQLTAGRRAAPPANSTDGTPAARTNGRRNPDQFTVATTSRIRRRIPGPKCAR